MKVFTNEILLMGGVFSSYATKKATIEAARLYDNLVDSEKSSGEIQSDTYIPLKIALSKGELLDCKVLTIYEYITMHNAKEHARNGHADSCAPIINAADAHANTIGAKVITLTNKPEKLYIHYILVSWGKL